MKVGWQQTKLLNNNQQLTFRATLYMVCTCSLSNLRRGQHSTRSDVYTCHDLWSFQDQLLRCDYFTCPISRWFFFPSFPFSPPSFIFPVLPLLNCFFFIFLDQELVPYCNSSSSSFCCSLLVGATCIRLKLGRIVPTVNSHRLSDSDFWYDDVILSRW